MVISTQTSADAAALLEKAVLQDTIQVYNQGDLVTVGFETSRELTAVGDPIAGLVQTTVLQNAVESQVVNSYSIKVAVGQSLTAGQVVKVLACTLEPDLVGKRLLVDKVSQNGASLLRKAVASDYQAVDQQGKAVL